MKTSHKIALAITGSVIVGGVVYYFATRKPGYDGSLISTGINQNTTKQTAVNSSTKTITPVVTTSKSAIDTTKVVTPYESLISFKTQNALTGYSTLLS
jgi:hypothetical protein